MRSATRASSPVRAVSSVTAVMGVRLAVRPAVARGGPGLTLVAVGAKVLFIGLDSAEPTLLEQLVDEGELPAIAALRARGVTAPLDNRMETLPGAIWPEIVTGVSAWRRGLFFHPLQAHTGEAQLRPVEVEEEDPEGYFWVQAARAGKRIASIDPPQCAVAPDVDGVLLIEWATHDRNYRPRSEPPELLAGLHERWGPHPIWNCNQQAGVDDAARQAFLPLMRRSVDIKAELTADLLVEDWDLLACTFGESHCVGHQYWAYGDPRSAEHRPDAPEELQGAVRDIYTRLDGAVGRLVAAAGPDATVVVLASHGMGPYAGGPDLLYGLLARLGLSGGVPAGRRAATGWRRFVPRAVKRTAQRVLPRGRTGDDQRIVTRPWPIARGARAFVVPNNRIGAIRLNLVGREPNGTVTPGADADALMDEITRELLALRRPDTGEPVVAEVVRSDDVRPDRNPDTPDLLVRVRQDVGRLWAAESERVGLIQLRPPKTYLRNGDHTPASRVWAAGPGVPAGRELSGADVLDIAPTILQLLGVDPPEELDGRALFEPAALP